MKKRTFVALFLLLVGVLIWMPSSNLVELIIENKEIVFGRYSRTHFIAVFLLALIVWLAAAVLFFTRNKPKTETVFALVMTYVSTTGSIFFLVEASGFLSKPPRYVEQVVNKIDAETGIVLSGVTRHRPPNEHYVLTVKDVPEQLRSYPDAPAGYPPIPVTLTVDKNGFRNQVMQEQYDVVVVGDSFVAGSQVSDDQGWTELLRKSSNVSLYNLGVSGTAPNVYLNNFVMAGRQFKPKTVLVMIYEGNDFRDAEPLKTAADIQSAKSESADAGLDMASLAQASPVTLGLKRLSAEVFAAVGKDRAVPEYKKQMGWMPLAVSTPRGVQYYSFVPKRLTYLYTEQTAFEMSSAWKNTRAVLEQFVSLSKRDGFRLVLVYAPSAPHVLMPLVRDKIPADALLHFARYSLDKLAMDAEAFKRGLFANLDSQENVMMHWCAQNAVDCVSATQPLREAAAAGQQVYFTYDQHWTPEGNAVVASMLEKHLATLLSQ